MAAFAILFLYICTKMKRMKKIFLLTALSVGLVAGRTEAQVFSFDQTTTTGTTAGAGAGANWDDDAIELVNHVNNLSQTTPITDLQWQIVQNLDNSTTPGWFMYSFCDNFFCDIAPNIPQTRQFLPIAERHYSDLKIKVAVPDSSPNGMQGVIKVRVWNAAQDDTAIYVATKGVTGVSVIKMNDNRVSIYPNPSVSGQVTVFANSSLKARALNVYNILGARVATHQLGGEVSLINVANYASGTYFFTLLDANGAILTSRKFVKM